MNILNFIKKNIYLFINIFIIISGIVFVSPPTEVYLDKSLLMPFQSFSFPLGADKLGRNVYSLFIYGMLSTILISIPARIFTILVSLGISLVSLFLPGFLKDWVGAFSAVFLSIPSILIALVCIYVFGSGFWVFLIAITLADWAPCFESLEGKIREIKDSGYVLAAQNFGAGRVYIFGEHILPELVPISWNLLVTGIPAVVMTVSIFSYLGVDFGTDIFGPGLGEQISFSKDYAHSSLIPVFAPILGIILLVTSVQSLNKGKKETGNDSRK